MITRQVAGTTVAGVGLGTGLFGLLDASHDEASLAALRTALDAGIDLLDTALAYTSLEEPSHGERLVAEAIRSFGGPAHVSTKGGHFRAPDGFPKDGRPETIKAHCELSLRTLGVDSLWLYFLHWPDPRVPVEESMGAFAQLQQEGKVQHVGVSNFSLEQLAAVEPVVRVEAVQNHFSVVRQDDRPMLDHCADRGIAYLAWSPLGGHGAAKKLAELVPALATVAEPRGLSVQQVALAWLLTQSPTVVPLAGCSRPESVLATAAVLDLTLTDEELEALSRTGA